MAYTMAGTTEFGISTDSRPVPIDAQAVLDHALPRIFGYILIRVAHDSLVAEDLTQETMIAFAQAVQSGKVAISDPMAWLFGTARNKVIDHFRKQQRTVASDPWPESDVGTGNDRDFDRVLDADELSTYLAVLPPMQQLVLVLHYSDGLRVSELATKFGRSEHAIESLLARGRAALRQQIKRQGAPS